MRTAVGEWYALTRACGIVHDYGERGVVRLPVEIFVLWQLSDLWLGIPAYIVLGIETDAEQTFALVA
jgi:hypothetical protein